MATDGKKGEREIKKKVEWGGRVRLVNGQVKFCGGKAPESSASALSKAALWLVGHQSFLNVGDVVGWLVHEAVPRKLFSYFPSRQVSPLCLLANLFEGCCSFLWSLYHSIYTALSAKSSQQSLCRCLSSDSNAGLIATIGEKLGKTQQLPSSLLLLPQMISPSKKRNHMLRLV